MPFSLSDDGSPPLPQPSLMVTGTTQFYLSDEFYFVLPNWANGDFLQGTDPSTHGVNAAGSAHIRVTPRHTDLASVPKLLWGLMASYGRQTLPALLHDQLCDAANAKRLDPNLRHAAYEDRCRADNLFRHALRDGGMDGMRRWTFWSGVTIGRYKTFHPLIAVFLGAVALAFSLSLYAGLAALAFRVLAAFGWVRDLSWPVSLAAHDLTQVGVLLVAAPLALSFLFFRRRLWAFLWVAAYVALPVLALLLLGLLVLLWTRHLPWLVQWLLDKIPGFNLNPGPLPPFSPTGLRPM